MADRLQPLFEADAALVVHVRAVSRDRFVAGGAIEAERLDLAVAGLEADGRVAEGSGFLLERREHEATEAPAPLVGAHVHAPDLARRIVVARDPAAGHRAPLLVADDESPVGCFELGRIGLGAGAAPAAVVTGYLGHARPHEAL